MCGISGFFSPINLRKSNFIVRMSDAIKHRGPDDEGFWLFTENNSDFYSGQDSISEIKDKFPKIPLDLDCKIALGFRRLSILDLSSKGHQPMSDEESKIIITFNGEIYNFKELRKILQEKGHVFSSETDTEVILKGYQEWNTDVFEKLNGMFSICIVDLEKQKILLARDRFGLKPLFYYKNENSISWASEIKAILECDWVERKINWEGVYTNFLFQTTLSPQTCFENVFSLEPGSFMEIDIKKEFDLKIKKFFSFKENKVEQRFSKKETEELFQKSIEKQLYADVPMAIMMSGGIDSTFLAYEAKKYVTDIPCFTLDYQFSKNEIENAEKFAEKEQLNHKTYKISNSEILADLKKKIQHFEEPYVSLEVLLNVSEIAQKNNYKIVLSGNGADELFGGYMHLQKLIRWKKYKALNPLVSSLPKSVLPTKFNNYFQQNTLFDFFRNGQGEMRPTEVQELFTNEQLKKVDTSLKKFHLTKGNSYKDYFLLDMRYSLASHHVYRDDLAAMMFSVEFRYPYLDNNLANYISGIPEQERFNGKENKPLLREAVGNKLPDYILEMPKKGFSFPLAKFINENEELKNLLLENINNLIKRRIFNTQTIEKWLNNGIFDSYASKLWQLLTFELWLQKYLDPSKEN